jgi:hypothetical protein
MVPKIAGHYNGSNTQVHPVKIHLFAASRKLEFWPDIDAFIRFITMEPINKEIPPAQRASRINTILWWLGLILSLGTLLGLHTLINN